MDKDKKKKKKKKRKEKEKSLEGHRELCEVYFTDDGGHEILKRDLTRADDSVIMDTVKARGLDKKLFEEFLSLPIMKGMKSERRNPEFGVLVAMWYDKSKRRKKWHRDGENRKRANQGYNGSFTNVTDGLRDAIVQRDHPSAHVSSHDDYDSSEECSKEE